MAHLDDLIDQVADNALRDAMKSALVELKTVRKSGLVFEQHIPETILLASDAGIAVGDVVTVRSNANSTVRHTVTAIRRGKVTIASDGDEQVVDTSDLLVVKPFGVPIYPVLREAEPPLVRTADRPFHAVINGENFHALQLLRFAHRGQVDCIYIDPPYNTGARDWKYNNKYIDVNDSNQHSKWLSMMDKRLRLASDLLRPDGVLIVTIDEFELHHLALLLESIFPGHTVHMVSIVINGRGSTGNQNFAAIEEQALFVVPKESSGLITARENIIPGFASTDHAPSSEVERILALIAAARPTLADDLVSSGELTADDRSVWDDLMSVESPVEDDDDDDLDEPDPDDVPAGDDAAVYWRGAVRTGQGTSFRTQRPNQFYPLYIDPRDPDSILVGSPLLPAERGEALPQPSWDEVDGRVPIWPVDEDGGERVWCYKPDRMKAEIASGNIKVGRFNPRRSTYAVSVRRVRRTRERFRERTIWWEKAYDSGSNGTNVLKRLLGSSGMFPFPKSVYAVRDVLATVIGNRPNALVLDFFAGSGTTLHATAMLNAIDNGQRRCILVTNNEVDEATAARLNEAGHFIGDPEFEAMGIARRVTFPRTKAALTGVRPDGTPIPGNYKWAGGRAYRDGFDENCAFYDLRYADADHIAVGESFEAILPSLWLAAGAPCRPLEVKQSDNWLLTDGVPFAVLLREDRIRSFAQALRKRPDVTHVWLVTDSDASHARMMPLVAREGLHVGMLYRDYLESFRANVGAKRAN